MLKITKRLSESQEEEYIKMVRDCIRRRKSAETKRFLHDFCKYIVDVLREIKKSGDMLLYNQVIDYLKNWNLCHSSLQIKLYKTKNIKMNHLVMAWIVMPQELMKKIHNIVKKVCAANLNNDDRWKICYDSFSKKNVNNWVIELVENKVCPYCNLSFIYSRTPKKTTAELDHFYNKSTYQLFALNFYNLIPVCHSCNHIKTDKDIEMISPYDKHAYDDLTIGYEFIDETNVDYIDLEDNIKIVFNGSTASKKHLGVMHIEEAYEKHKDYAEELIQKIKIFNNRAARELIQDGIGISISTTEFEQVYFGKYRYKPEKRILGKMTHDFLKEHLK